jgi:peptidoglycan hydrolase CwlO-like protein
VAESRAGMIQGRIEELFRMREQLLDRAIASRQGDVQDIQRQLDQIQQVMDRLQGQLATSRREMDDLQGLRRSLSR